MERNIKQLPMFGGRKGIGRSVTLTYCTGSRVDREEQTMVDFACVWVGKVTCEQATRRLRKVTGDDTLTIYKAEQDTDYYSIPLETFVRLAIED